MKTIFTLSLLPIIVLAYFFSVKLYIVGEYFPAYALIAISFASIVYFIYQAGSRLENSQMRLG
jgi:hypothetical protein